MGKFYKERLVYKYKFNTVKNEEIMITILDCFGSLIE
jgi:hypothetical protein